MSLILILTLIAAFACIRYERGSDRMFRWSRPRKAWVPVEDYDQGLDQDPSYVLPPVQIDWTRPGPSTYPISRSATPIGSILRLDQAGEAEMVEAQWGIIPVWADAAMAAADARRARPPKVPTPAVLYGKQTYNCRNDSLAPTKSETKATWRGPFHEGRRCIVPAAAIYERDFGGDPRWIRIRAADHQPLAIAGLWEEPNRHVALPTFTMVTTDPNLRVGEFHDRMPVFLDPDGVEEWLSADSRPADLLRLLTPAPEDAIALEDGGLIESRKREEEPGLF